MFRWRAQRHHIRAGSVAGSARKDGYWAVRIDGRAYPAHRLAWLYVHGEWPPTLLDHRDTDRANNAIGNLRPATKRLNGANAKLRSDSLVGLKGVHRDGKRFAARITVGGKLRRLGIFDTPREAHAVYVSAAVEHFGEFARAS